MISTTKQELINTYSSIRKGFSDLHNIMKKENLIDDDFFNVQYPKIATPEKIVELVNDFFDADLRAKNRKKTTIYARQAAAYILRKYTHLSLQEIAFNVGLTDHTSAIYHVRKCQDIMDTEEWFRDKVYYIIAEIEEYLLHLKSKD
jgi:chromosomal replication initiation ATPase DnaA